MVSKHRKSQTVPLGPLLPVLQRIMDNTPHNTPGKVLHALGRTATGWTPYKKVQRIPEILKWAIIGYATTIPNQAPRAPHPPCPSTHATTTTQSTPLSATERETITLALALMASTVPPAASPTHRMTALRLLQKGYPS